MRSQRDDRAAFGVVILVLHAAMIAIYGGTSWYSVQTDGTALYLEAKSLNASQPLPSTTNCKNIGDSLLCTDSFINDYDSMFQDIHVMVFVGIGFLMSFMKKYSYSAIGISLMIAAFSCEWGALLYGYFFRFNSSNLAELDIDTMINADFTAITVLISMGATLGKTTPLQLLIMALFECVLAQVNRFIGISLLLVNDPGGAMFIHTFGAYFGMSVATVLAIRRPVPDLIRETSSYTNDVIALVGTLFLWIFFPSFNAALVHGNSRGRAVLNTYMSLIGSTMMVFALSSLVNLSTGNTKRIGRLDIRHIQTATLAGGVVLGASANLMVSAWASLLIGSLAGTLSLIGVKYLQPNLTKLGIHDTCGVNNLHGMSGFLGGLVSVLFGGIATFNQYGYSLYTTFPAMAPTNTSNSAFYAVQVLPGLPAGSNRTNNQQAGYQMAALMVTMGIAVAGGWLTGGILRIPRIWGTIDRQEEYFTDDVNFLVPDDFPFEVEWKPAGKHNLEMPYGVDETDAKETKGPISFAVPAATAVSLPTPALAPSVSVVPGPMASSIPSIEIDSRQIV